MANENLSQSQIDALFNAKEEGKEALDVLINQSKEGKDTFKEYDFLQPDKFNLDNTNSLKQITKTLGRNLSQTLTAKLRLSFPLSIELNRDNPLEQLPYSSEYVEKMPKDRFVFVVIDLGVEDLGKVILQIDLAMVKALHQKSTGAATVKMEEKREALTFLERVILLRWLNSYVLPDMEKAFKNIIKTKLEIRNIEMDPQQVPITTSNDMVALIMYDAWFENEPNAKTQMFLCIPYLSIEPIIDKLTTENIHEFKITSEDKHAKENLKRNLLLVKKKVDVELGKTQIKLKELLGLKVGDVLRLDKEVGQELIGYIGDKPKFSCLPGKSGAKVAVKVTGFARKGGDKHE